MHIHFQLMHIFISLVQFVMVFLQPLMGFLQPSSLSLITEFSPWELSLSIIVLSRPRGQQVLH